MWEDGDWMCCLLSVFLSSTGVVASSSSELDRHFRSIIFAFERRLLSEVRMESASATVSAPVKQSST